MRALAFAVLLVAGCATTPGDLNGAKSTWQGATYDEVVSRWGVPNDHTLLTDGTDVYTWNAETVASRGMILPSIGIFGGSGGISIGTGATVVPGGGEPVRCSRTLIFRNARIVEQIWQGDPGFCENFKR